MILRQGVEVRANTSTFDGVPRLPFHLSLQSRKFPVATRSVRIANFAGVRASLSFAGHSPNTALPEVVPQL